jgi:cytochrome c-type biogenesis protein CcmH/NrfF
VLALVAGAARAAAAPQMSPVDLEREARSLEAALIAPCCFSQQVSVHESPASDEVRRDVRARLAAGQTRQQILDAYVKEYGKRILAVPPPEGFDVTLYVTPIAVFVLTAVVGVVAFHQALGAVRTGTGRRGGCARPPGLGLGRRAARRGTPGHGLTRAGFPGSEDPGLHEGQSG